ncbi:MAG TPA: sulfatase-like hydrolase/transferase [Chitinophagaceae bacterium]|nr:sulfatase-like hydrolase/transferase [Chitinophagaceae bacterium]
MKQIFSRYPFFLYLLPVFFVLHGYIDNLDLVPPSNAFTLTIYYLAFTLAISIIFRVVFSNFNNAALFSFVLLFFYFFFGSMHDFLKKISGEGIISRYIIVLPAITTILILIFFKLKNRIHQQLKTSIYLNTLLITLLVFDISRLVIVRVNQKKSSNFFFETLKNCNECTKPDIYIIIADEYAGNLSLREYFNYDNSSFLDSLSLRGFRIINKSTSNYNATAYTMASLFTLNYIRGLKDTIDSKENISTCYHLIRNNQLVEFLKENGYRFINYSGFEFIDQPGYTQQGFLPGNTAPITNQTLSGRLMRDLWFHLVTDLKWEKAINDVTYLQLKKNNKTYDQTKKIASEKSEKPKLVYTHLVMPHNPYYYNREGILRQPEVLTQAFRFDKAAYAEYLQYVNNKLLELIDQIRSNSITEPVIFLAGDHGFRHYGPEVANSYQFDNLSAISMPGRNYEKFNDSMTLINQMRTVLNIQFRQQLPLLRDSCIFIKQ